MSESTDGFYDGDAGRSLPQTLHILVVRRGSPTKNKKLKIEKNFFFDFMQKKETRRIRNQRVPISN